MILTETKFYTNEWDITASEEGLEGIRTHAIGKKDPITVPVFMGEWEQVADWLENFVAMRHGTRIELLAFKVTRLNCERISIKCLHKPGTITLQFSEWPNRMNFIATLRMWGALVREDYEREPAECY